jgi:hypothetical protein
MTFGEGFSPSDDDRSRFADTRGLRPAMDGAHGVSDADTVCIGRSRGFGSELWQPLRLLVGAAHACSDIKTGVERLPRIDI